MQSAPSGDDVLAYALAYAELGWRVFPVHSIVEEREAEPVVLRCSCGKGDCGSPGKHPRTKNGVLDASTDPAQIRAWWEHWPMANVGIACGEGLLVLDVDGPEGEDELRGRHVPMTPTVQSGKGQHRYFRTPGFAVKNKARVAPGLDVRTEGGYVVAPPSLHVRGVGYAWVIGMAPWECPLADCPEWLVTLLEREANAGEGRSLRMPSGEAGQEKVVPIPQGRRNDELFRHACKLRNDGHTAAEIEGLLLARNRERCKPPLPDEEVRELSRRVPRTYAPDPRVAEEEEAVRAMMEAAEEEGQRQQRRRGRDGEEARGGEGAAPAAVQARPQPKAGPAWSHTDLGNAERMCSRHGDRIRYSYPLNQWYVWNGTRWEPDQTGDVEKLAVETVRSMLAEVHLLPAGSDEAAALYKHVLKSEGERRLAAMTTLARALPGIAVRTDELDADPWAFNCTNGTIDLRTGALRPHRRSDLITRLAPVAYDGRERSELWERFLGDVTGGDVALQEYLQLITGYAMTGSNREEKLFFVHGPPRTGKSTYLSAVMGVMGDYATSASVQAFMEERWGSSHSEEIACLAGRRLVSCVEIRKGRRWDEEMVKRVTGGDTVRARALYQQSFEFLPQFKIFVAGNDRPRVRHDSDAMWRRMAEVPFVQQVSADEEDPSIKERLTDMAASGPAILAWAVQGAVRWYNEGLTLPPAVAAATELYRADMDPFAEFLAERCTLSPGQGWTAWRDIWDEYTSWVGDDKTRRPLAQRDLQERLTREECVPKRDVTNTARGWQGIALHRE
jgi:putative DNA primase/helicase